ncbi:MAG: DUF1573 domain-containing protein [Victivallales bacterium]
MMNSASLYAKIILAMFAIVFSCPVYAVPTVKVSGDNNKSIGTHYGKDSKMCSFVIENTGDEPLAIKGVNKTCGGCVEISVSEKEISPGKTAEIKLKLVPGTLSGPYTKNFFVETNDPKQRFVMFTFSGTSVPFAEIKPSNLMYMGKMKVGTSCRREFLVVPTEKGTEFGKPEAECGYPVEVSSSSNEKGLSVFFGFIPEKNLGDMKCRIKIPVLKPEGWPPLEILISATIADPVPPMSIVPSVNIANCKIQIPTGGGFSRPPNLDSKGGQESPPPVNYSSSQGRKYLGKDEKAASGKTFTIAVIEYFHQAGCGDCRMIDTFIIPKIEENFKGKFKIGKYDTSVMDNFLRFAHRRDKLDIQGNETVCMVVNGRHAFNGYKNIEGGLLKQIESSLKQQEAPDTSFKISNIAEKEEILKRHADRITLGALVIAGLVDGINPCVFSTLVFFISVLAVSGVKGGKLVFFGSAYCAACFITYLLLGLGILRFFKLFSGYEIIQDFFNRGMFALLMIFAVLSFRDAWLYWKTGLSNSVLLQLPESVKTRIHKVIREGAHFKHLAAGAVMTGFLVTLLESVCTGQVYLPALALLAKQYPSSLKWLSYLILYNVMFIIPLLAIFAAAYAGAGLASMLKWSKQNVVAGKAAMGIFFLVLGILILTSPRVS